MKEERLKWQCGLDIYTLEQADAMLDAVGDMPDIIEVGTPLIFNEGTKAIELVRRRLPNVEILVDSKIIDATTYISKPFFEAGADIATVDGGAHDYVISEMVRYSHELGKPAEADLMNVANIEERAQELLDMGVDIIGIHAPSQALRPNEIKRSLIRRALSVVPAERACLAHSITLETLDTFLEYKPGITVVQIPVMLPFFRGINEETKKEAHENALKIYEIFEKHRAML